MFKKNLLVLAGLVWYRQGCTVRQRPGVDSKPVRENMKQVRPENIDQAVASRPWFFRAAAGSVELLLVAALLAGCVWAVYGHTLAAPFVFDDWRHIEGNPHIRLASLKLTALWRAAFESPLATRPVANISFAFNYYFNRYDPAGYHLVNILIHLVNAILLYWLVKIIPVQKIGARPPGKVAWMPLAAAVVWAVHPLHVQSVTYVIQRMNSLAVLCYLLAMLLFARARLDPPGPGRRFCYAGCLLATILALGSKEISVTLPIFFILFEWYFVRDLRGPRQRGFLVYIVAALAVMAIAAVVFLGNNPLGRIVSSYSIRDFTLQERLLTQPRVIVLYLSQILFPHPYRLNLDHDFALSSSLLVPGGTLPAMLLLAGLFAVAVLAARKERLLSFAVIWLLVNFVIESSVFGLELVFEHRTYLPSVFIVPALVLFSGRFLRPGWRRWMPVLLIALLLAGWTFERNRVWLDEVGLRRDCLQKSPGKPRAYAILANALERRGWVGDDAEAATIYQAGLQLSPTNADEFTYNLGNVMLRLGQAREAESYYRQSLALKDQAVVRLNLGVALERQGREEAAAAEYAELLQHFPGEARAYNNLGRLMLKAGRLDAAIGAFREALRLRPSYEAARRNLEQALDYSKESGQRVPVFSR